MLERTDDYPYRLDGASKVCSPAPAKGPGLDWLQAIVHEPLDEGIALNRLDRFFPEEHVIRVEGPATFSIAVILDGHGSMAIENGPVLPIHPGVTVLFHAPHDARGEDRIAAGSHTRCLDFRFSPALLTKLGSAALAALVRSASADCSVQDSLLLARPTPAGIAQAARDVEACALTGVARRIYLRAKALEILAQIVAMSDPVDTPVAILTKRDRERVKAAAAHLTSRFEEPWTIARLAREVGLNERKLKAGFRAIVGRTVHDFLEETRLDAAARLLEDSDVSVTDVALAAGYANPSHFAKLFRRQRGMTPREWRRR